MDKEASFKYMFHLLLFGIFFTIFAFILRGKAIEHERIEKQKENVILSQNNQNRLSSLENTNQQIKELIEKNLETLNNLEKEMNKLKEGIKELENDMQGGVEK